MPILLFELLLVVLEDSRELLSHGFEDEGSRTAREGGFTEFELMEKSEEVLGVGVGQGVLGLVEEALVEEGVLAGGGGLAWEMLARFDGVIGVQFLEEFVGLVEEEVALGNEGRNAILLRSRRSCCCA